MTRWAEEGLKSRQVNYVNISTTGMSLQIQNAKVYQAIGGRKFTPVDEGGSGC